MWLEMMGNRRSSLQQKHTIHQWFNGFWNMAQTLTFITLTIR